MTEAEWQSQVLELARIYGWKVLHVRKSIGRRGGKSAWQTTTNISGWPDLLAWHETQRRVLAVELKSEVGRTSQEQRDVLASLAAAGVESFIWRPSQLDEARDVLKGGQ